MASAPDAAAPWRLCLHGSSWLPPSIEASRNVSEIVVCGLHGSLASNLAQRVDDDLLLGVEIDIGLGALFEVVASGGVDAEMRLKLWLPPRPRSCDLLGLRYAPLDLCEGSLDGALTDATPGFSGLGFRVRGGSVV
jgi:hypothetical protein